jgi:Tfp pilus assembly protein PilF
MNSEVRRASLALAVAFLLFPRHAHAEAQWIKARLGSFEAVSDNGRKSAVQGLSQFEQFRFALGTVMGKPDLRLDPPLRIIVFRNTQEMPPGCEGLHTGRDRLMACITAEGQLPASLVRQLTQRLLEENFATMPAPIERALETFFSTVQSNAVRVTWGAPPPQAERTREWALLHRLIIQPDYSGRAHIYLHNLASGMDSNGAIRSLSEDPAKFNAEVDRYFAAGVFTTAAAPNRPLNPDRDFATTMLTTDEGQLARADLLTPGSAAIYQALLKEGKHVAEDNEGLSILAARAGDSEKARSYMEAARSAGTKNVIALTAYGSSEKDPERAIAILKEALTADPKYAPAHWALGEKLSEPPRRLAEWKQAVALAPRNYEWWAQYAKLCESQKQFTEAGRAWLAAAQAAPDVPHREQYLAARGQIEQLRLDEQDAARRKEAAATAAELERLKAQARKEIADLEARVNTRPLSKEDAAKVVDWTEVHGEPLSGTLLHVQCAGKQLQLDVKADSGQVARYVVPDPAQVEMTGSDPALTCGAEKPRPVTITWKPVKNMKGIAGEITAIEFR